MKSPRAALLVGPSLLLAAQLALAEPASASRCLQNTPAGLAFVATPECLSAIKPGAPARPHIFNFIGEAGRKQEELESRKRGAGGRSDGRLKDLGELSHWENPPVSGPLGRVVRKP